MSRSRSASSPALRSVLITLALVAGVLAMHALGGGAHSAGAAGHGASATSSRVGGGVVHQMHMPAASAMGSAVLDEVENLAAGLSAQRDETPVDGAVPAAMCVAMLLSAVVLLRRRQMQGLVPRHAAVPARGVAQSRGRRPQRRPPDLVAELCVMRT